jgi:glycosyltransferase involved in cell wall biosynthesis
MRILIIGSVWVEPKSSAAGSRMLQLIHAFKGKDWDVHFACGASFSENAIDLTSIGVKTHAITLNNSTFNAFAGNLQPDVVVFDRFMTEEQYAWRVAECCPDALRVLNTEDLHCLRHVREEAVKNESDWQEIIKDSDMAKREIAAIFRSDLTLMISSFEMQLLQDMFHVPKSQLHYCPFIIKEPIVKTLDFDECKDFVFIGNFKHKPNADAVMVLKKQIWPVLSKLRPEAKLHIYGAYADQKHLQLSNPVERFLVHGKAESAQDVFVLARVLLAPLRFGAGLKGKLIEAMQYSCPSVTTSIGAEGIGETGNWPGFVVDSMNEFSGSASVLYSNKALWNQSNAKGEKLLKMNFMNENHSVLLIETLISAKNKMKESRRQNFVGSMLLHHSMQSTKFLSRFIEEKNKKK